MNAIARALVVAAVVALATLGEGGAQPWSLVAQHVLLAAAVAACALRVPPGRCIPARGPASAWLAFAVLAAAGAVVAPYAYAAWLVLVEVAAFGALAWLACGEPAAVARVVVPAAALLAAGHGAAAVVQKFSGASRPASTFLNPNHLAAWLAAAVLVLAGRIGDGGAAVRSRAAFGAAAVMALAGIFVTGSRGALLGLAVGAVAFIALVWGAVSPRARLGLLAGAAMALLAVGGGVAARFKTDLDPYALHRTSIWAASLGAVVDAPWRGAGPGQFAAAAANLNFPLENAPLRHERSFKTPHSDVLRAFCEFGIPAGLAAVAAAAMLALAAVRRRARLTWVERGAFAALVCLAAQASVDDLSIRPALTLLGAALAGLLVAVPRVETVTRGARVAAGATALLLVASLGVGEVAGFVAWRHAEAGRWRRALAWNPMQPAVWRRIAERLAGDGRSWSLAEYAEAREAAERARRLQPADASYARGAARVEATACLTILPFAATRARAAGLYDEAARLARTDATIPLEAAKFLLQAGDAAGARRAAEQALRVEPRSAVPRLWLARAILVQEGAAGSARARALLDEALALAPRQGEVPTSSYDASLRVLDPRLVAALGTALDAATVR